ncbi:Protein AE7 [Babesia bovis T2Bo]|uniref:MIP18 family-like domain-containing protein n=1 Tax=Babesia bovis TaxID=5865 RepID=A7APH3_BABBO|nr:Protein AE7 [Babesia bovis T2Bo]EDO08457.1 Protein AE7 [Babesia bovis T2Bo]|eukprot:XP_001612025.1 hypothetical protein [Babesia bovis T2Bo]
MDNANPIIYKSTKTLSTTQPKERLLENEDAKSLFYIDTKLIIDKQETANSETKPTNNIFQPTSTYDEFEVTEIFNIIRNIKDPEYSYTLESLKIVEPENIDIDQENAIVTVKFTPTVPHCSQATIIGLMIYVKLQQSLPLHFKIDVQITEGTHNTEDAINKQLLDKERVAAALENPVLLDMINDGIYNTVEWDDRLISI